jgi:hypothetical protein
VDKIIRLHLIQNLITTWASTLGFSEATVPTFGDTIASGFVSVVSYR